MRYIPDEARLVWSASDLKAAAECEFAWLRALDARLGRCEAVDEGEDATLARASELGDQHEQRVLQSYRDRLGAAVVEIEKVSSRDGMALAATVEQTEAALRSGDARVVFQAAFSTDEFVGFADFLLREADGAWRVQDSKLARTARVTALMQLAAYVDQLDRLGIARSGEVDLLLGDGTTSTHAVDDILPLFQVRRDRLRALIADRRLDLGAAMEPIAWGDGRDDLHVAACGRCTTCEREVIAHRDLLLVAGMRPSQRERLRAAGVRTIDDLAGSDAAPEGMSPDAFSSLRMQAALQLASPGGVPGADVPAHPVPAYEVAYPAALGAMPRPSAGDIFFDFEGDPLYSEASGRRTDWGIDYLFGWVDLGENYSALWAHTLADERVALERFLDLLALRRRAHPDMHVYHYAPYEPSHLASMAARHGVRESEVDALLRDEVFVDLYPIVRRALRVGSRSYSIKKLEPLYMGDEVRTQDVQRGDESIERYVQARALAESSRDHEAGAILDDLADYNRYDCVSTRRLRDWLVERAREAGVTPAGPVEAPEAVYEPSPIALALAGRAAGLRDARLAADPASAPDAAEDALRLAAAAIDYYPREAKSFWLAHYERLREPIGMWADARDVLAVDRARTVVDDDWALPERGRVRRRLLRLRGDIAPGSRLSVGAEVFLLYASPAPFPSDASRRWMQVPRQARILESADDGVLVEERSIDGEIWDELPLGLTPGPPPRAGQQQVAINEWAQSLIDAGDGFPADPATDILLRRRPRGPSQRSADRASDGDIEAIADAVAALDRSFLAVQGPPGTGKTYVGSHVIARLVAEHGFRIGVVAQSHAVVENMLDRVVAAGVASDRVAKAPRSGDDGADAAYTVIPKNALGRFIAEQPGGFVVGGTAWDFAHPDRVMRGSLDLLVIDEAGQFSLAATIAVAVAARRLLLLGDPQQLPQVSTGIHPEPVDTSALGWVMDGRAVLPAEYGHFLARSWRMHPAVAESVSHLAYDGRLASRPGTERRSIAGVDAGLHVVPVRHDGDATSSAAEAAEVVRIARELVGRAFTDVRIDDDGVAHPLPARALTQRDVIVVAPYNAQRQLVADALAAVGFDGVRVGTVDRFQGQEAAVSIVTLAASSGRDAPRGVDFLLLQNRLNVAISRAQVAAFLVHSPALLDDLPRTAAGVARMSAFARLVR